MSASLPIAIADALVGAAVPQGGRLRFAATDPRLRSLDGTVFDSPAAARHLAEAMLAAREPVPRGGPAAGGALLALLGSRGR
ncbi:MAG: hypothetical protein ACOYOH_22425 [Paracraurococcus sp.]|jgi:hypothetical protein